MIEKAPQPKADKEEGKVLPSQRIYSIADLARKSPDKVEFMAAMKKGGISLKKKDGKGKENITPIDFFATSGDLSDDEILEAIEGYLGVDDLEQKLDLINDSLDKARDFMKNYLYVGFPREIENLEKVKNKNDILKIFKKTAAVKKGDSMGYASNYCALVSVFAAAFEFRKGDLKGLLKESEYIYKKIKEEDEEGNHNFVQIKKGAEYDMVAIYDGTSEGMMIAESYFRGKSENSFMAKLLNKPEATAKEASKDAIGIKFEMKNKENIERVALFLENYLKERFGAKKIVFENTKLFEEGDDIYNYIEEIEESENPHTNPDFKAFKINGAMSVPKDGDESEDAMIIPDRQFEIQIVLTDNKNESGYSHHSIYEASKKLAIFTRIVGSLTEEYLDIICEEASKKSGLSAGNIKNRFKKTVLKNINVKGSKVKRIVHERHADRYESVGLYPDTVKIGKKKSGKSRRTK